MVFAVVKSRWVITACLIIAILTLVSLVFNGKQPDLGIARDLNQRSVAAPVYGIAGGNIKKVAVSFGQNSFEESPNRLQIPAKNGHGSSSKRAYPDTLSYAKAVENGKKYLGIIEKASQEPVWTKADFDESGWTLNSNYPRTIANELIVPAQEKGISTNAADINKIAAQQFSEFTNMDCERQDDPSGGQFIQSYIPVSGTIMAVENISPQANIATYNRQNDFPQPTTQQLRKLLPAMQRWSDIVWYVWATTAKDKAGDLRYIFRDHVINNDTKGVIDQIFKVPAYTLDFKWPGKTFDVGTNDGKALLGTPHGTGIAYLLADNKKTLGERSLKITCFTSDSFRKKVTDYFMLFELVRV